MDRAKLTAEEIRQRRKMKILARASAENQQPKQQIINDEDNQKGQNHQTQKPSKKQEIPQPLEGEQKKEREGKLEGERQSVIERYRVQRNFQIWMNSLKTMGKGLGIVLFLLIYALPQLSFLLPIVVACLVVLPFMKKPKVPFADNFQLVKEIRLLSEVNKTLEGLWCLGGGVQCCSSFLLSSFVLSQVL